MLHLEARTAESVDVGGHLRHVIELGGSQKARLHLDQRDPDNPKMLGDLVRAHPERRLDHEPGVPIKKFKKTAVEDNAGGIAMTPFHRELPAIDEICH